MPAPSQSQSHLRFPLTSILGSAGNLRVLRVLACDPAPRSAPEVARLAGLSPQGVRLVLDVLVRQRVVIAHGSGRAQLYALNASHAFAGALTTLFQEEQRRWEAVLGAIRKTLARYGTEVSAAWFYGSVARGEDAPESDLDLAIVVYTPAVADQVREDLQPLEDANQLRISLAALTPGDLAALPDGDPWWSGVVRDGRVLLGPAPEQARRRLVKLAA